MKILEKQWEDTFIIWQEAKPTEKEFETEAFLSPPQIYPEMLKSQQTLMRSSFYTP